MGYSRTLDLSSAYSLSDVLLVSNDDEKNILNTGTFALAKEIVLIQDVYPISSLRVKHDGRDIGGKHLYTQVFYNGVAVGAIHDSVAGYTTYTDDLAFTNLMIGDRIQLYAYVDSGVLGFLQNFRIYGTANPFHANVV